MSRTTPTTIIFCNKVSQSLEQFALSAGNNGDNDTKKTNQIAQKIYANINPEYYKTQINFLDKITLFILNLFNSDHLTKVIGGIVTQYLYSDKENNIPLILPKEEPKLELLIKEDTKQEEPPVLTSPSHSTTVLDEDTDNPYIFNRYLISLNRIIKSKKNQ